MNRTQDFSILLLWREAIYLEPKMMSSNLGGQVGKSTCQEFAVMLCNGSQGAQQSMAVILPAGQPRARVITPSVKSAY